MSSTLTRFTRNYMNLARSDVAHDFPRHVFLREPNKADQMVNNSFIRRNRVNPENVQEATLVHLTEPHTNTELYLIGTLNSSNFLAQRTKNLIREVKPDTVFIQANQQWATAARKLRYVKSQEEMNLARPELQSTYNHRFNDNLRKVGFLIRTAFTQFVFRYLYGVRGWNPALAGLEAKYALEEAEDLGANLVFLGHELDHNTWERLYHENRNTFYRFFRNLTKLNSSYCEEFFEHTAQIKNHGYQKYVEGRCDQYQINWFIQTSSLIWPELKKIFVDQKDEDLFKLIIANRGKRSVAVVNQWHLEGIEHHWCHAFGQKPRAYTWENINPIGDMDLRTLLFERMYHGMMRDIKSSLCKSPPSSFSNGITPYYRESVAQYEHRNC